MTSTSVFYSLRGLGMSPLISLHTDNKCRERRKLAISVLERVARQAGLVNNIVDELRVERSYRGIERLVQLVIQAMLDLGLMVISALKGRIPKAYSEIGYILQDLDILEKRETKKAIALLRQAVEMLSVSKGGEA